MKQNHVFVRLRFTGNHYWKEASGKQAYLRHPHRHEFHITAAKTITELNRQIEFLQLKEQIQAYVRARWEGKTFEHSCEMIAQELIETFKLLYCVVSEDGENGCLIHGEESS